MLTRIALKLLRLLTRRPPDVIIGGPEDPYIRRWWVIPRNRWANIYLHQIMRDDDDRALHDHPWDNVSIVLDGPGYLEVKPSAVVARHRGSIVLRRAEAAHRLVLFRDASGAPVPTWSLFVTGRLRRSWGFHCPKEWRHWKKFVDNTVDQSGQLHSRVGRGCD